MLSLNADLFGKSLSSLQFQHHKNKLFFGRNGKIIRRGFYIRLFDKPVTAGRPDNDLVNVLIALNCDLRFHWSKPEKAYSLISLQEIIYSLGRPGPAAIEEPTKHVKACYHR